MALFVADVRDNVIAMLGDAGPGKLAMLCKPDAELSIMALRKANAQLRGWKRALTESNVQLSDYNEVLRMAAMSPYPANGHSPGDPHRRLTWRECGEDRNDMNCELSMRLAEAESLVDRARHIAWREFDDPVLGYEHALSNVNNILVEALRVLRDEESAAEESEN